jgi:hypothetical protein
VAFRTGYIITGFSKAPEGQDVALHFLPFGRYAVRPNSNSERGNNVVAPRNAQVAAGNPSNERSDQWLIQIPREHSAWSHVSKRCVTS